ncbi:hypothetical protein PENSPDRAFT_600219 [Peniophora sp. CONT]|nr:hypothetical protein PENSPDRAFT_600219 [Peniophora sp. CONT]
MLQELSSMDRITQLQDEIQKLLTIMTNSINYLTTRTNFVQISENIPVTKQRKAEKYDTEEVFEANKKELIQDLVLKAKQVEFLIQALPQPEPEEEQAKRLSALEKDMQRANDEYIRAVNRAKALYAQISETVKAVLDQDGADTDLPG